VSRTLPDPAEHVELTTSRSSFAPSSSPLYSGPPKGHVLANEAVNLGIAIYNMQGEGIRCETLFRDETVGALDAANGREYVRMLRRTVYLGGFYQVIFICHSPIVWELADQTIHVRNGSAFMSHHLSPQNFITPSIETGSSIRN